MVWFLAYHSPAACLPECVQLVMIVPLSWLGWRGSITLFLIAQGLKIQAIKTGAVAVLEKPINHRELLGLIKQQVNQPEPPL